MPSDFETPDIDLDRNVLWFRLEYRQFQHLTDEERDLAMWAMTCSNEVNVLYSAVVLSLPVEGQAGPAEVKAGQSQVLFFLQLLAGKLCEAWKYYQNCCLRNEVFETRRRRFPGDWTSAASDIENYFRGSNPIEFVRQKLAYHYDARLMAQTISTLKPETDFNIWFTKSAAGVRYDIGSVALWHALNEKYGDGTPDSGYNLFLSDVIRVSRTFAKMLHGIIELLVRQILRNSVATVPTETREGDFPPFLRSDRTGSVGSIGETRDTSPRLPT